jgi:hypothetical protein
LPRSTNAFQAKIRNAKHEIRNKFEIRITEIQNGVGNPSQNARFSGPGSGPNFRRDRVLSKKTRIYRNALITAFSRLEGQMRNGRPGRGDSAGQT